MHPLNKSCSLERVRLGALDEWLSQRSAKPSTAVRIRQAPQSTIPESPQRISELFFPYADKFLWRYAFVQATPAPLLTQEGNEKTKEKDQAKFLFARSFCDSGGIQTHNLLIRSQMLYSVELRNLLVSATLLTGSSFLICGCKGTDFF